MPEHTDDFSFFHKRVFFPFIFLPGLGMCHDDKRNRKKSGLAWLNGFFWRGIKDFSYRSI